MDPDLVQCGCKVLDWKELYQVSRQALVQLRISILLNGVVGHVSA